MQPKRIFISDTDPKIQATLRRVGQLLSNFWLPLSHDGSTSAACHRVLVMSLHVIKQQHCLP